MENAPLPEKMVPQTWSSPSSVSGPNPVNDVAVLRTGRRLGRGSLLTASSASARRGTLSARPAPGSSFVAREASDAASDSLAGLPAPNAAGG